MPANTRSNSSRDGPENIDAAGQNEAANGIPAPNQLSENQIKELVTNQFSVFLAMLQSGQLVLPNPNNSEEARLAELDRAYRTPPFHIPVFEESDKLQGYKNVKAWKLKLELSLEALMLLPFIKHEAGATVNVSPARRDVLNAQTLQVLQASLSKSNNYLIQNIKSAYEAYSLLTRTYSNTRMRDYVQLNNRLFHIKFKPGFDPVRFITDYENILEDFNLLGCVFPPELITSMFLHKIIGITDPKTIYFAFFNSFAAKLEMPDFITVKESFLQLDHESAAKQAYVSMKNNKPGTRGDKRKTESDKDSTNTNESKRRRPIENDKPVKKYTDEQVKKLKAMSSEEKRNVQCSKCGDYFHKAEVCPHPGRVCYNCHDYGHEAKACPKPKRSAGRNDVK